MRPESEILFDIKNVLYSLLPENLNYDGEISLNEAAHRRAILTKTLRQLESELGRPVAPRISPPSAKGYGWSKGNAVKFVIGEGSTAKGKVLRVNTKTVTVLSDDGGYWVVRPGQLQEAF